MSYHIVPIIRKKHMNVCLFLKIQHTPVILKRITQRYFENVEGNKLYTFVIIDECFEALCHCPMLLFSKQHTPLILERITNKKMVRKITKTVVSMGTCCGVSYALFKHTPPQTPHGDVTEKESQETHWWVLRVVFCFLVHFQLSYVQVNSRCKSNCCSFCCSSSSCHTDCSLLRCSCRNSWRKRFGTTP